MDGLLVDSEVLWHQAELELLVPLGARDRRPTRGRPRGCSSTRSSPTTSGLAPWQGRRSQTSPTRSSSASASSSRSRAGCCRARRGRSGSARARAGGARRARPPRRSSTAVARALRDDRRLRRGALRRATSPVASRTPPSSSPPRRCSGSPPPRCLVVRGLGGGRPRRGGRTDGRASRCRRPTRARTPPSTPRRSCSARSPTSTSGGSPRASRRVRRRRALTRSTTVAFRATRRGGSMADAAPRSEMFAFASTLRRRPRGARPDHSRPSSASPASTTCCRGSRPSAGRPTPTFTRRRSPTLADSMPSTTSTGSRGGDGRAARVRVRARSAPASRRGPSVSITSPVSDVRQVFELMADESEDDREVIDGAAPRRCAPRSASWREGLADLADEGRAAARAAMCSASPSQAATYADGAYAVRAGRARAHRPTSRSSRPRATPTPRAASSAAYLRDDLAPKATEHEACGVERYARWLRSTTTAPPST